MTLEVKKIPPHKKILSKRLSAFYIDLVVVMAIGKSLLFAYKGFLDTLFFYYPKFRTPNFEVLESVVFSLLFFTYFSVTYYLADGQSLGKLIMGLKVHSPSKRGHITFLESCQRSVGYLFCLLTGMLFFALPFLRKDKRGIPDFISKTLVIYKHQFIPISIYADPKKLPDTDAEIIYLPDRTGEDMDQAA